MRGWECLVAEISATGLKIFPYEHSILVTGTTRFYQISFKPSQQSGQNGIILPSMYFYFRSMRFIFVYSCVTRVDKATIQRCCAKLFLFIKFYLI